jgi:light-regulated signal transduction histidine kinase (bacteriophytochrome)
VAKTGKSEHIEDYNQDTGRWYDDYIFKYREDQVGILFRDITPRKNAEKRLKEAINELKRSNKELEQFAYVSSHDLQEPLRTIASFTQLLERRYKGKFDSDADEFMEYIVEAAVRMKEQIEGLLEYSRVATKGRKFKPTDMNEIIKITNKILNTLVG